MAGSYRRGNHAIFGEWEQTAFSLKSPNGLFTQFCRYTSPLHEINRGMPITSENNGYFVSRDDVISETNDWTQNDWLCRPGMTAARELLMVRATMESGHCHPFHRHPHREEIIHVIEGKAEQWVGDEFRVLGPGEIAIIPPGVPHGTFNPFPEKLVFHAILSSAILDEEKSRDADPHDVSTEEPWASMRKGMTPCRVLGGD